MSRLGTRLATWRRMASAMGLGLSLCAGSAASQTQTQTIHVLTGGHGGVYYPIGVALSHIFAQEIPHTRSTAQVTRASVENLSLLQAGRGELALTLADAASHAWNGVAEAGFRTPHHRLRGVSATYSNYIQLVAHADSGIRTLADLQGKRVSVGSPRSGTELNARALLKAAGLNYGDLQQVEYLSFADSVDMIQRGQLDATLISSGLGAQSVMDLATSIPMVMVPIPAQVVARVGDPAYQVGAIPAGTYPGQTTDVATAVIPNFLMTHSEVPEELVYRMTRALYTQLARVHASADAARAISLPNALQGMPVPLHPGAARYYREVGLLP